MLENPTTSVIASEVRPSKVRQMIKLFSLKQDKEKEAASASSGEAKIAPGLIRMQKGKCSSIRTVVKIRAT